ncbi:hypothetical protein [Sandaracinobacter neustonicus]|nr:hypothetical protein [Sandaracinobacter neustonicus]
MKRLALLLMLLPAQVQAQAASFEDFFGPFRAAVLAGDAKAIRAHTRLPFLFQGRMLDASGFEAAVPALFDPPTQACFRKPELVDYGGSRQIFCQGSIYIFADDGGWKFIEIGVDD